MHASAKAPAAPRRLAVLALALALTAHFVSPQTRPAPDSAEELARAARAALAQLEGRIRLAGLRRPVEVIRDEWGVPHIYAKNTADLFFAQGFVAAQDRLWQMELWRRAGEGRLAEVLGPTAVERDKFARLMRYRGDMDAEWASYAPDARRIVESFVRGVNAFIETSRERPPIEFQLAGFRPEPWTPEVCLLRVAGLEVSGNAAREVQRAQLVRRVGAERAGELMPTDPHKESEVPVGLDLADITGDILAGMRAATAPPNLRPPDGSNNWVVSGALTATGKPLLANDPHRGVGLPSLRYITHLVGPGWNVIGAGEPALPGVSIGHNERVGFGVTIVGIDQQDLYVEQTDPADSLRYRHHDGWEQMRVEREEIKVKGRAEPLVVELKFTRHGPVVHEDTARHRAYALRTVASEPGTAAYLAALSLDRARGWREFIAALARWKSPSENFVYADVAGNIGWQAAGLAPVRPNWSGLLPVPGWTGDYEWRGFLPPSELPRTFNPRAGFIATANHNILPPGYRHALGYEFSPDVRFRRIVEVLRAKPRGWTAADFARLQHDETSIVARELVPLLRGVKTDDAGLRQAVALLLSWDFVLAQDSAAAALYEAWFGRLSANALKGRVPEDALRLLGGRAGLVTLLSALKNSSAVKSSEQSLGLISAGARDELLLGSLVEAVAELRQRLGVDMNGWRWGDLHVAEFRHPLATDAARRALFDLGAVARGGDATTVMATGGPNYRQNHGASFREILDLSNWDSSLATNVPGESAQPLSPHYGDLLSLWAEGRYFPLLFTRAAVERHARHRLTLEPAVR